MISFSSWSEGDLPSDFETGAFFPSTGLPVSNSKLRSHGSQLSTQGIASVVEFFDGPLFKSGDLGFEFGDTLLCREFIVHEKTATVSGLTGSSTSSDGSDGISRVQIENCESSMSPYSAKNPNPSRKKASETSGIDEVESLPRSRS